jgi:hypothetical protein
MSVEITRPSNKTVVVTSTSAREVIEVSDPGPAGPPNSLSIGSVTTGEDAEVTITGTAPTQTLNFVLPIGAVYRHTQSVPSDTWTINHNVGYYPGGISVVDSGGNVVIGNVNHISNTSLTITFTAAFSGYAHIS